MCAISRRNVAGRAEVAGKTRGLHDWSPVIKWNAYMQEHESEL